MCEWGWVAASFYISHICIKESPSCAWEVGQSWGRATGKWRLHQVNLVSVKDAKLGILELRSLLFIHGAAAQVALNIAAKWHQGCLCHLDVETSPDLVTCTHNVCLGFCPFFFACFLFSALLWLTRWWLLKGWRPFPTSVVLWFCFCLFLEATDCSSDR